MPAHNTRQVAAVEAIRAITAQTGDGPTAPELAKHLGFDDAASASLLKRMVKNGYVEWSRGGRAKLLVAEIGGSKSPTTSTALATRPASRPLERASRVTVEPPRIASVQQAANVMDQLLAADTGLATFFTARAASLTQVMGANLIPALAESPPDLSAHASRIPPALPPKTAKAKPPAPSATDEKPGPTQPATAVAPFRVLDRDNNELKVFSELQHATDWFRKTARAHRIVDGFGVGMGSKGKVAT